MRSFIRRTYLQFLNFALTGAYRIGRIHPGFWRFMARNYHPSLNKLGKLHAYFTCAFASKDVPAYKAFLKSKDYKFRLFSLASFPETSKDTYVTEYGYVERCRGGELRFAGTAVDESSGSSGRPFNWLRSKAELRVVHKNMASYATLVFPSKRRFIINAYSMGAWATGTNTGIAMARIGIVKNTGPDIEKIIDTLEHFGGDFEYIITAYPPFMKHLRDKLDERGFDWSKYRISGLVGGEGMTEALRDYLEERFWKIRSGYGASDLTIGVAGETAFVVWLRKTLMSDRELRTKLLGPDEERTPMLFQYNPLENYLEINENDEVVCTLNSSAVLCPKLRYNIGDEGAIWQFHDRMKLLKARPDLWSGAQKAIADETMKLPVLVLYGRKDSTISYMGANLYPQDIEYGLYDGNPRAKDIERFCLTLIELDDLERRPVVNIELREGVVVDDGSRKTIADCCRDGIIKHLMSISRDFAESVKEDASALDIRVEVHDFGTGPFASQDMSIKNKYLVKA